MSVSQVVEVGGLWSLSLEAEEEGQGSAFSRPQTQTMSQTIDFYQVSCPGQYVPQDGFCQVSYQGRKTCLPLRKVEGQLLKEWHL